jgi:hypothetical protein
MPVVRMGFAGMPDAKAFLMPPLHWQKLPQQEKAKREYTTFSHDNAGTEYLGKRSSLHSWPEASQQAISSKLGG